jgi:hypothetical protein
MVVFLSIRITKAFNEIPNPFSQHKVEPTDANGSQSCLFRLNYALSIPPKPTRCGSQRQDFIAMDRTKVNVFLFGNGFSHRFVLSIDQYRLPGTKGELFVGFIWSQ